jgi:hypothetical protein
MQSSYGYGALRINGRERDNFKPSRGFVPLSDSADSSNDTAIFSRAENDRTVTYWNCPVAFGPLGWVVDLDSCPIVTWE